MAERDDFKVYPRGFLGAHLRDRVQTEQRLAENNNGFFAVKVSTLQSSKGPNNFNHTIESLYSAWIREEPDVQSFEFRERVLTAALQAFGTHDFKYWFLSQSNSPFVGPMQRDFLDDCLRFIDKGRRHLNLMNWGPLLVIDNADGVPRASKVAIEFFGLPGSPSPASYSSYSLLDIVQMWCSKPGGLEDLLGTLHLLFGAPPQ